MLIILGSQGNSLFGVKIFNPLTSLAPFDIGVNGTLKYFSSSSSSDSKSPNFLYHSL